MLAAGSDVPAVRIWAAPREDAVLLREVLGPGYALLCLYLWDWSQVGN
jgi:hypothetical protein